MRGQCAVWWGEEDISLPEFGQKRSVLGDLAELLGLWLDCIEEIRLLCRGPELVRRDPSSVGATGGGTPEHVGCDCGTAPARRRCRIVVSARRIPGKAIASGLDVAHSRKGEVRRKDH